MRISLHSYIIENDVCYLVLCDRQFSKKLAYSFLEEISQEFDNNYGRRVNSVTRPYAFIEFDIFIQKARKGLSDRRRNINSINTQLQDVQRIMVSFDVISPYCQLFSNCFYVTDSRSKISTMFWQEAPYCPNLTPKPKICQCYQRNTRKTPHI